MSKIHFWDEQCQNITSDIVHHITIGFVAAAEIVEVSPLPKRDQLVAVLEEGCPFSGKYKMAM